MGKIVSFKGRNLAGRREKNILYACQQKCPPMEWFWAL
jgi:hypothetical protein